MNITTLKIKCVDVQYRYKNLTASLGHSNINQPSPKLEALQRQVNLGVVHRNSKIIFLLIDSWAFHQRKFYFYISYELDHNSFKI